MTTIKRIEAFALSCPTPGGAVFAVGRSAKRDMVLVRIETTDGIVGYGEAHHAQTPSTIAAFINDALGPSLIGMDAHETEAIWDKSYRHYIATHGPGAAAVIGLSGVDLALWDIKGKDLGQPVYRLLGGRRRPIRAYAGGISLGFQPVDDLKREIEGYIGRGYDFMKLRVGDSIEKDLARVSAIRAAFGPEITLAADAGTRYRSADIARIAEICEAGRLAWLEEPFTPDNLPGYRRLRAVTSTPLAAGENHFTRHELRALIAEQLIEFVQADACKTGGITEILKIAALADTWHLQFAPHTSASVLSTAASVHVLSVAPNAFIYEADVSAINAFRDDLGPPFAIENGTILAPEGPGLGVEIDERLITRYPFIPGASYQ
ncbi:MULTISPECIES: mandelate racemase/muconate lactonizing enzyme family protein [unclassified Chelatococcus]|uniref:mandelate racemase/muconate lactonizing enzyme family protein n=1 Tax=unclassified Chelatococcus TaxID=2638111 RepID=UPI001BCD06E7|nr:MULTISPECIES: mandelate racemase/muconate lactonizing enzyme family protein [unclassified Chelatococcus]CAH1657183.1 L-alanine-DL-glutamate epimerase-like enolase superfamily enzyme [Hyphomicrobiales bacterium]MBS7742347.1 mandelate racemase/muconate lactonizing enzyme family protein [Chelatococcus sp. HY11]MBX3542535.1 mandelate racemase/muconate lactonizing enzyme family protein [Chelatococcus sp.]MCO5075248.1 mandelate racemase/muconate lactonizing enzyme family protein [Chelatococcus sp.